MATKRVIYQYKDKDGGRIINNDDIVADDEKGIIEHLGGSAYRFIPRSRLSKEPIAADYGYDETGMPVIPEKPDTTPYNGTTPQEKEKSLGNYYDYTFGINKVQLSGAKPKQTSGFVSQDIKIGNCDYIELATKTSGGKASVEYYIIDGLKEIPIMPVEEDIVIHERLFYGLETRFKVDTKKPIMIFKNGEKTTIGYSEINTILFGNDTYTITYSPFNNVHQYYPVNKTIKVKIIERHTSGQIPATIDSVVILRHGGDRLWTI